MQLNLKRNILTGVSTIGELTVDGVFTCYTLENPVRAVKIEGHTAIPAGIFRLELTWSPRFKRKFPLLLSVPNFAGVRVHYGCFSKDTEGCILVGQEKGPDRLFNSRAAFRSLLTKLSLADLSKEAITITIE